VFGLESKAGGTSYDAWRTSKTVPAVMTRLTTMGELTASMTHEINQPLAAIVTQSEAALRFLNRDEPDLDEARDSLSSIMGDGMRAGEVIRGLRAFSRKSGPQLSRLSIDDVIGQMLAIARRRVAAAQCRVAHRAGFGRAVGPGRSRSTAAAAFEPDYERHRSYEWG
jgi:C4-dicarboxylate-specific signal transduction histidine kinase